MHRNLILVLFSLFHHEKPPVGLICCVNGCQPSTNPRREIRRYRNCWIEPLREKHLLVR